MNFLEILRTAIFALRDNWMRSALTSLGVPYTLVEKTASLALMQQAELVIIDITGVSLIDTSTANHLLMTTRAANLLGSRVVLVGIEGRTFDQVGGPCSPEVEAAVPVAARRVLELAACRPPGTAVGCA